MKYLVILIFTLSTLFCFGQKDSIDYYISGLNNKQFKADGTYFGWMIRTDSPSERALIKIGKSATEKLIKSLSDSTKFVMAYLTLSKIWSTDAYAHGVKWDSINKKVYMLIGESDPPYLMAIEKTSNGYVEKWLPDKDNIILITKYWYRKTKTKKATSNGKQK